MSQTCEFCKSIVSSKYILKTHLETNKSCLKLRNLEIITKFNCKGCNLYSKDRQKADLHQISCKEYQVFITTERFKKEIEELQSIINQKDKRIEQLEINVKKNIVDHDDYIKLQVKYDELSKQHEKTIEKLELKISQCDSFIQTLAREGSNKPTTTNNTINNTIRNHLSTTYTIDKLEPKTLEETFRKNYTEFDYYSGQKGLANFFLEKVIKTPDGKMMICCTDTSRKKFKILDMKGNLKEDIEARVLCEKLKVPTEVVTKEMYDKIITKIDEERERLSRDDRSLKEKLIDDSMRAQQVFIDNMNFDDVNYNQDFMHELCVLLNV
jgi:hypothetical protein